MSGLHSMRKDNAVVSGRDVEIVTLVYERALVCHRETPRGVVNVGRSARTSVSLREHPHRAALGTSGNKQLPRLIRPHIGDYMAANGQMTRHEMRKDMGVDFHVLDTFERPVAR